MPAVRIAQVMGKWVGGGVEAVVMNYYRNIDRRKFQFDFICDGDSTNIPYDEIRKLGGNIIIVSPYQNIIKYQMQLQKVLRKNNYKIIHSHINALSIFPLYAAKRISVPVRIAHSHSTTNKIEWKKNLLKQILRPFARMYATDYLACGEYAGEWLFGKKAFADNKVILIHNAIDLDRFKFDSNARKCIRNELRISDDAIVLGHIGRFVAQKNQDFLIEVFNEVYHKEPKARLILVGQGPDEKKIKEKVRKLGLSEVVFFLGQRKDVNKLYSVFDIFVLPSLYEGLPVVGVEAQACGLPCVFSDNVSSEAKILPKTEFLDLSDLAIVWADKILQKIANRNDNVKSIDELKKRGYDIKQEAQKLEKIYTRLMK